MQQKTLALWLKTIIISIALCGAVVYAFIIPLYGKNLIAGYPEYEPRYFPWLITILITAVPCYGVLILGWKIANNVGNDKSFCRQNAKNLKWISLLSALDSMFLFIMNIVMLILNLNHPGAALIILIVVFFGIAVSVASAVLSHLVTKAAILQDQSDLTI